jgi:hypothetical protein
MSAPRADDRGPDDGEQAIAHSDALHARVREVIAMGAIDDDAFDVLALAIARFQARRVAPLSRLLRVRGIDLDRATREADVPAIPTDVFRLARVAAHDARLDTLVFRTSGTTAGTARRGEHPLRTGETYRAAAIAWAERHLLRGFAHGSRAIALAPSASSLPDSSLSFMIDVFAEHLGADVTHHVDVERSAIDLDGLARACAVAREAGRPTLLFGTSFAFVWALDEGGARDLRLPEGSRAMLTGGFKGKTREVNEAELRAGLATRFGLDEANVVGEYGMTELSSQLYDGRVSGAAKPEAYLAPPWVRVAAVDPITLEPVARGEEGIARIVDLANVDSAVAVQTADRVRVTDDGVFLLGRLPGATPRGCSLSIEEMRLASEP